MKHTDKWVFYVSENVLVDALCLVIHV